MAKGITTNYVDKLSNSGEEKVVKAHEEGDSMGQFSILVLDSSFINVYRAGPGTGVTVFDLPLKIDPKLG